MNDNLDFSSDFDLGGDRRQLLEDAARRLDISASHLGPGSAPDKSDAGDITRAFANDQAKLGRPVIYRVEMTAVDRKRDELSTSVAELTRNAAFYCVSFPVSLFSPVGRGFNQLEVKVEFNPDDDGIRPTSFDVLPDQQWTTKFQVGAKLSTGVTADLKFAMDVPQALASFAGVPMGGDIGAQAGASTSLLLGPFDYALRVPQVVHTPAEHDHVFWRLKGGSFVTEQDPGLRVVLRVPRTSCATRAATA